MIKHIKVWNKWRKKSLNSKIYKLLVLLGISRSPTFQLEKAFFGFSWDLDKAISNASAFSRDIITYCSRTEIYNNTKNQLSEMKKEDHTDGK